MNDEIKLTDLINVDILQKIQDAFANATGMAALTVDLDGPVTNLSNPTEFCMELTRGSYKGAQLCNECDLKGGKEAGRTGKPSVYYCHGGLMDFAAPIMIGKKQIGSLIGGQVLPEPPDEIKFRKIAREIGVKEEDYIRALSKIKIVPKKTIEASAQLLYTMANALSDMGYQRYQSQELSGELITVSSDLLSMVQSVSDSIVAIESKNEELIHNMKGLSSSTIQSKEEVEKTNQIVKYIRDISLQTKLLGFNASVEASRSKEYGAGFHVIAQEIRRLTDTSQEQSGRIENIIGLIKSGILDIDSKISGTYAIVDKNTALLKNITDAVSEISEYAKKLDSIGKKL